VAELRAQLKTKKGPEGYHLWDEFKVKVFSRTIAAMYHVSLMNALVRLQLMICGRYELIDNQPQNEKRFKKDEETLTKEMSQMINGNYLHYYTELYMNRLENLAENVEKSVSAVMSRFSLGTMVSYADIREALEEIRVNIEVFTYIPLHTYSSSSSSSSSSSTSTSTSSSSSSSSTSPLCIQYLIKPKDARVPDDLQPRAEWDDKQRAAFNMMCTRYHTMVAETENVLQSASFEALLKTSFDASFDVLYSVLEHKFKDQNLPLPSAMIQVLSAFKSLVPTHEEALQRVNIDSSFNLDLHTNNPMSPVSPNTTTNTSLHLPSLLLQALADMEELTQFMEVIYYPLNKLTELERYTKSGEPEEQSFIGKTFTGLRDKAVGFMMNKMMGGGGTAGMPPGSMGSGAPPPGFDDFLKNL
jgi:hypothetical protein